MSADIKTAISKAGNAFEADIAYWTDPKLKKFTGLELLAIAGGAALAGFIYGFFHKIGEKAGAALADDLVNYISTKIAEAKERSPAEREEMLEQIRQEVIAKIKEQNLDPKQLGEIADTVQTELSKAFLDDAPQAPEDVRSEIAQAVRDAAMEFLAVN